MIILFCFALFYSCAEIVYKYSWNKICLMLKKGSPLTEWLTKRQTSSKRSFASKIILKVNFLQSDKHINLLSTTTQISYHTDFFNTTFFHEIIYGMHLPQTWLSSHKKEQDSNLSLFYGQFLLKLTHPVESRERREFWTLSKLRCLANTASSYNMTW